MSLSYITINSASHIDQAAIMCSVMFSTNNCLGSPIPRFLGYQNGRQYYFFKQLFEICALNHSCLDYNDNTSGYIINQKKEIYYYNH